MAKFRYLTALEFNEVISVEADCYEVDANGRLKFFKEGYSDAVHTANQHQWVWVDMAQETKTAEEPTAKETKTDFGFDFSKLKAGLTQEQIDQGFSILQNLFKKG